jgi:hypothetical protein
MLLRNGWNTSMGRQKFDVEVSETDLVRILHEAGVEDAAGTVLTMPTRDVFLILQCEAEIWATMGLRRLAPDTAEDAARKEIITSARTTQKGVLARYLPPKAPA